MARDPKLTIRAGYAVTSVPSTDLGNSLARTQRELGSGHDGRLRTKAGPLCVTTTVRNSPSGRLAAPRALHMRDRGRSFTRSLTRSDRKWEDNRAIGAAGRARHGGNGWRRCRRGPDHHTLETGRPEVCGPQAGKRPATATGTSMAPRRSDAHQAHQRVSGRDQAALRECAKRERKRPDARAAAAEEGMGRRG